MDGQMDGGMDEWMDFLRLKVKQTLFVESEREKPEIKKTDCVNHFPVKIVQQLQTGNEKGIHACCHSESIHDKQQRTKTHTHT